MSIFPFYNLHENLISTVSFLKKLKEIRIEHKNLKNFEATCEVKSKLLTKKKKLQKFETK